MWIAYSLSIIGLVLIYLEFFMPGGIIALLGGLLLVGGVTYFSSHDVAIGYKAIYFALTVLTTAATCKLALWVLRTRKNDQFYLNTDQEGFVAGSYDKALVGQEANAASDLKPSGHIQLKEKRFQAISEGEYITKGSKIIISGGRGAYLIVKSLSANSFHQDGKQSFSLGSPSSTSTSLSKLAPVSRKSSKEKIFASSGKSNSQTDSKEKK